MMSASSSSATVAVEKATSDLLIAPDWTMNIDICDSINSHHWQAKDVVKAVKKRLQHKNSQVQLLALTLLETMVKNCGDFVHFQIAERNILGEMVKIVRKKADMQVRDKILALLDSWQEAFGGPGGKYPQYYYAYEELRRSGVIFPQRSPDAAPIFTPPATHEIMRHAGYGMPSNSSRRLDETMATEYESLSLSSLDSMRDVLELLSDMLQAVNPGDMAAVKDEVIVDLVNRCRSNQKKLMQMLTTTGDEDLLGRGLELNDSLQSVLAKHDAIASGSSLPSQVVNLSSKPTLNEVSTSDKPTEAKDSSSKSNINAPAPVAAIARGQLEEDEEEDDFAQLARRHSKAQPTPGHSTNAGMSEGAASMNNTSATSYVPAASAPVTCTALALPSPPAPVRTTKEQDMIDLLSLTLSTTSTSPHTPQTPSASYHNIHQVPVSPGTQGQPSVSQTYPGNQGQVPYNTYVAPWAQAQPPPQSQPQQQPQSQAQPLHQIQSQHQIHPESQSQPQFQSQSQIQLQSQFPSSQIQSQSQNPSQMHAQPQTQVHPSQSQPQTQVHPSQSQPQIQSQYQNPSQLLAHSQNHLQPQLQSQAQNQGQSLLRTLSQPQYQNHIQPSHQPLSQSQYPQYSSGYPPPPWAATPGYFNGQNSFSTTNTMFSTPQSSMTMSNAAMQAARPSQLNRSYTAMAGNGSTTIGDPQASLGPRNPTLAGGQKPFIPSYRLFEDLNVLGNADGRLKMTSGNAPSLSSSASQGMIGSRK
ncbi:hypothetical protein SLEP1_g14672 [Rubroshorea leprosula]|uniref:Uncharacterized protein n=1 Tax=Rubroshorea leprosula TaxID=152421 RepID=A0AAV5IWI0_9ROSI|nr:hypothetical protein SLEP1_g14672 [Rubroshorea leprosula]